MFNIILRGGTVVTPHGVAVQDVVVKGELIEAITNPNAISSEKAKPTDSQLNAVSSQATVLENNAKVDDKRKAEYLSWQEQFEMIYKDQKNGTSTYKDHCDKVRSDNPKE